MPYEFTKYDRLMYPAQVEAIESGSQRHEVTPSLSESLQVIEAYINRKTLCASHPEGGDLQVMKRGVTFAICADPAKFSTAERAS